MEAKIIYFDKPGEQNNTLLRNNEAISGHYYNWGHT